MMNWYNSHSRAVLSHLAIKRELRKEFESRQWWSIFKQLRRTKHGFWHIYHVIITINLTWVFQTKLKSNGEVSKYKGNLVAGNFMQKNDLDFYEFYALVARL